LIEAFDGCEDLICGFEPAVGLRIFVVSLDERLDVGFKLADRSIVRWSGKFGQVVKA
jgi:hypothetical protein